MKGTIEYMQKLRDICREHTGDCKACPLGEYEKIEDCRCPRLNHPNTWSNHDIVRMVKI